MSAKVNPQNDGERLAALEQQVCNVERQVEALDVKLDDRLNELNGKLDKFIDAADSKYATKLSEKVVFAAVGLTLAAVLTALLAMVVISN